MNKDWSTVVSDWQGVDDEPVAGSDNLIKSGGVSGQIRQLINLDYIPGGFYLNATIGNVATLKTSNSTSYILIKVKAGEKFKITGLGSSNARIWATLASDMRVLRHSDTASSVKTEDVLVAEGESYLVANSYTSSEHSTCLVNLAEKVVNNSQDVSYVKSLAERAVIVDKQTFTPEQQAQIRDNISALYKEAIDTSLSPSVTGRYAMLATAEVGKSYELKSVAASSYVYWAVPCAANDVFHVTTKNNSTNAKAYAILDENNVILALHQAALQNEDVVIPAGGKTLIVNSDTTEDYSVVYKSGKIAEIKNEVADARNVPLVSGGYYKVDTIGNVAKYVSVASMSCRMMKVSEGDIFNISGLGSSAGRLWATLSSDYKVVRNAPSSLRTAIVTITEEEKYLVINSDITAYPKCDMVNCSKYAMDTRYLLPILPEVMSQKLDYIKEIYVSPNYTEGWEHMYLQYIVNNEGNYRITISNATSSSASDYAYANRILTEKPVGPISLRIGQGAAARESGIYVVVDWDLAPSGNITINAEIYPTAKDAYLSPSCYAYYKNDQLSLYVDDIPMFSLIDDDFAVPAKCEILANICEDLGIRCTYALIPTYDSTHYNPSLSDDKKAKVVELMERGHEFVMHPNHQLFYGADGTTQGTPAECEKNLVQTRRFFDENNILNGSEYLVWPGNSGLRDELIPMAQRQVKLAIHSGAKYGVYINTADNFNRYQMLRESLFRSESMDKALVKSQIDTFASGGKGWCIFVMHSHWLTNDNIVDNTSNTFANLREILEYALSKNISFGTIHEGYLRKVMPEYLPKIKLGKKKPV